MIGLGIVYFVDTMLWCIETEVVILHNVRYFNKVALEDKINAAEYEFISFYIICNNTGFTSHDLTTCPPWVSTLEWNVAPDLLSKQKTKKKCLYVKWYKCIKNCIFLYNT